MALKRIFIAVDISAEARRIVAAYIDQLRSQFEDVRAGWEKAEKLHFTVRFLGKVEKERIAAIEKSVADVCSAHEPFEAEIAGTGVFPNAREPRILWLGLGDALDEMVSLGRDVNLALDGLGSQREPRDYVPHLTIARVREPRKAGALGVTHVNANFATVRFRVGHLTLYESVLSPAGSTYQVISRVQL